jgi:hypothetical protein
VFKIAFFILRLLIALGALAMLAGTAVVFLFENFVGLIKGLAAVAVSVTRLFASGFRTSTDMPAPSTVVSPILAGLAIAFLSIFASVFMPGQKIFLHIVAVMAVLTAVWDIHRAATTPNTEVLCLPVIVLWFIYYGICLRRG